MIVIEAPAIVDALVEEPRNPELLAVVADSEFHTPARLDYEVASALRGHPLAGRLTEPRLADAVDDFSSLHIDRYPLARMMRGVPKIGIEPPLSSGNAMVGPVGLEPTTYGLKVRSSAN